MGVERLACGILKRLSDDVRFLFYTGGNIIRRSDGHDFRGDSNWDAFWWDLSHNTGWHDLTGTRGYSNIQFVKTNPYTGFAFNGQPYRAVNWWIWEENSFRFVKNTIDRPTQRHDFSSVAIPKLSPFLRNCFN